MNGDAILEIVDAVKAIVDKHHGVTNDTAQLVDYAAVATLALADMGYRGQNRVERELSFDKLAANLKRMCRRVAESGFAGLMGGHVQR
jgi:hypothetical protein